jgi:Cdc6-like AAA superfamily ATPase
VKRAWNSAKDLKKSYLLRKLTDHHRLLYELIAKNKGILSGDLWRLYLKTCHTKQIKPIAVRTYSDYCNKLVELGLVQAKRAAIQGKVRQFSTVQ